MSGDEVVVVATGATGPTGAAGVGSYWRSGSGAPSGSLGSIGDFYLDTATGNAYEKTGASAYTLRVNLTGPTGATGNTGSTGAPGGTSDLYLWATFA